MPNKRTSGVLMSISSLPSPYGVGVFGEDAVKFAKKIKSMGFSAWQVLPFTPLDYAYSPYGSDSAFAGNELYISPDLMVRDGFVTRAEAEKCIYGGSPFTADYQFAYSAKDFLLRTAFLRLSREKKQEITDFVQEKGLVHHCLYRALKDKHKGAPFWEWGVNSDYKKALESADTLRDEMAFHGFVQYLFLTQWAETKKKINELGVKIIGDMPIYVSRDSADVFANPDLFLIDKESFSPELVAGVPPDYFSEDGQLWGNPLYDWNSHEKQGFDWWIRRISHSFSLYDVLRIDHFRAFASFWAVDGKADTAKNGKWMEGPGIKLFDAVKTALGDMPIIAEDLGAFSPDVLELLENSGFPGMRIIQFGFEPDDDSSHLPHNYPHNCVAYVGTHDNNTLLGWLWEATPEQRGFAAAYCAFDGKDWGIGGYKSPFSRRIIESVWRSAAKTAIISYQDLCGFGSDARMNTPGKDKGNWLFRTTWDTVEGIDADYYSMLNNIFKR